MTFRTQRRVEFRDTDMAGIMHFSAFFPLMEASEHELFRSLGLSVLPRGDADSPAVTWPRVSASCDYRSPARFEDLLDIEVSVARIGTTSVTFQFQFLCGDRLIADGSLATICCRLKQPTGHSTGGRTPEAGGLEKTPIPESIRQLLMQHH